MQRHGFDKIASRRHSIARRIYDPFKCADLRRSFDLRFTGNGKHLRQLKGTALARSPRSCLREAFAAAEGDCACAVAERLTQWSSRSEVH